MSVFGLNYVSAATTFTPSDLYIVTANGFNPDLLEFVSRVDMDTGTVLFITDNAWTASSVFASTEGFITYTTTRSIPK